MRPSTHLILGFASLASFAVAQSSDASSSTESSVESSVESSTTVESTAESSAESTAESSVEVSTTTEAESSAASATSTEDGTDTSSLSSLISSLTSASTTAEPVVPTPTATSGPGTSVISPDAFTAEGNAELVTIDGQQVYVLTAEPGQDATIRANVAPPADTQEGDLVTFSVSAIVEANNEANRKRQEAGDETACRIIISINSDGFVNAGLVISPETQTFTTDAVPVTDELEVELVQTCDEGLGAKLTVFDFVLTAIPASTSSAVSSDIASETSSVATITTTSGNATITTTSTSSASTATSTQPGFPDLINGFRFFGCVGSQDNFPTFREAFVSDELTIGSCTDACRGSAFAGLHEDSCFCGQAISNQTERVPTEQCDIPCPGNGLEFCGGNLLLARSINRRQFVSNSIRLTVYAAISILPPVETTTVTTDVSRTITDGTATRTTVIPTTITNVGPRPTDVVCYDGRCGTVVIILKPHRGEDCYGEVVYEKVPCTACSHKGEHEWKPVRCVDDRCHGKTVYKPEECTSDCYKHEVVEKLPCDCEGGVIYKPKERPTATVPGEVVHTSGPKPDGNNGGNQGGNNGDSTVPDEGGHVIVSGAGKAAATLSSLLMAAAGIAVVIV